jgi:hypothetical protein
MPVGEAAPEPTSGQFVPKLRACQGWGYDGVRVPGRNGIREKRRLKTQAKINPCEISKQTAILVLLTTPKSVAPYSIHSTSFHVDIRCLA